MVSGYKFNLNLFLLLSVSLHAVVMLAIFLPDSIKFADQILLKKPESLLGARDIIVNINQDNNRVIDKNTLLSDKDSSARGYITKEKGDRWLNNSLAFRFRRGSKENASKDVISSRSPVKRLLDDDSSIEMKIIRNGTSGTAGSESNYGNVAIPDKNGITMKNAIYYSNSGLFSFNTAKFKNFLYFKEMKDKIASNWYPPLLANALIGSYAPGGMRIMAIPSQQVKLYFIMNRNGDILKVAIVDSLNNKPLDNSCLDAIRLSKNFGKVPDDIKGEFVLIPFIFGYYSN